MKKQYKFYPNGNKYEGELQDGLRDGLGTMTYTNGDIYEGKWHNNMKNGYGIK